MRHSSWRRFAAGVAGALLVAGCAPQVFYTPVVRSPRPLTARPVEEVETFLVTPPSRPHTDVGVLQVTGAGFGTKELIRVLRARAARVGCDALLITSIDLRVSDATSPSIQGSCVVYNDVSAAAPAAAPVPPPNPEGTTAAPQTGWRIGIVTGTATVEVHTALMMSRLSSGASIQVRA